MPNSTTADRDTASHTNNAKMPARQSIIAIAPATVASPMSRHRPMTSKQAKKAYAKATKVTKLTKAQQRRMEAEELAEQKKEFERERALARARAARERKAAKEEDLKLERKKAGVPEKSRWVRPSQGRITGFLGLGKRAREEEAEGEEAGNEVRNFGESATKRIALDCEEEESDEEEPEIKRQMEEAPGVREGWDNMSEDEAGNEVHNFEELATNRTALDCEEKESDEEEPEMKRQMEETPEVREVWDNILEDEEQPQPEEPKLPVINEDLIDFQDDDEELAAQQLQSETSAAVERSEAAGYSSPNVGPHSTSEHAKNVLNQSPIKPPSATHVMTPAIRPLNLSPKPQAVSSMSQGPSRAKIQFACSGMSPELTPSNPFSQRQTMLRSVDENVSQPAKAVATPVMGPPGPLIRSHATPSKSISSQGKQLPPPRTIASMSQRNARIPGANISIHRRPLSDITTQAQNIPAKALVTHASTHSKPLLKSSLNPSHLAPKPSPFELPTSTQLFLEDHLDDFFPSPSQEMRELLDDIGDDDIPSNTQIAREIESNDVPPAQLPPVMEPTNQIPDDGPAQLPPVIKPADPVSNDDFSWLSTQDFLMSSQELRELETPSEAPPPPTPWDVRKARKPRFFVEKEEDLLAAAIDESKAQEKIYEEAEKLRIEDMRIERELYGTRRESTQRVSQAAAQQSKMRQQALREVNPVKINQQEKPVLVAEEDDYGDDEYGDDDFDDAEAEASMIAFVDEEEKKLAPDKDGSDYGDDEYDYGPCDDYEFNCGPYYSRNGMLHTKTHWAQGTRYEKTHQF